MHRLEIVTPSCHAVHTQSTQRETYLEFIQLCQRLVGQWILRFWLGLRLFLFLKLSDRNDDPQIAGTR